ncbi:hypothetical protein BDM02DRAFT_3186711 [Thelephora ganbajun]|uniref:Uncharacterized protein n=1 Tax=Thelephora ganbajun TaxID=370292 RepID=A0ACB6ZHV1_THEGA|nr:hypothetical protein BDM02DRAFT_3186711 [Thelephora ganbajun]
MADSKSVRSSTHLGSKRPAMLSLKEPTKRMEDSVPLLLSVPPAHRRAQTMPCPMSPMTPDLDTDDGNESPGSSQSSSTSSTFTFNLLSPTMPHHNRGFSFTACPSSPPLGESMVYAFPPEKRPTSTSFPTRSRRPSVDHSDLSIVFDSALSEGIHSPYDDRKYFHVQFLQEDSPFPKTPDC